MKHIKLFEAFVNEKSGSVYGDVYTEKGFNLMQKDLERLLNKYGFKYSIKDPKSKEVVYNINGTDVSISITIYRNYDNYFGKFYLYMYSEKLKPKSQTTKLENKDKLDNILGQVAKTSNVMSPDQLALKKNIDDLSDKLEDILYMYGDSDEEMDSAMNTAKFKNLDKKIKKLQSEYSKKYEKR